MDKAMDWQLPSATDVNPTDKSAFSGDCVEIASEMPVGGIIKHTSRSVGPKAIAESRVVAQEDTTSPLS